MSLYLDFNGIDDGPAAKAILIGLAQVGMLHARTVTAVNRISDASQIMDWRDPLPDGFLDDISAGMIRTDAKWSKGDDPSLSKLAEAVRKYEPEEDDDVPAA